MTRLPIGMIVLIIVSALIYFGLAQRVLDRLKLSDKGALIVVAALIAGSFITIPISGGRFPVTINVGGALVPLGVAIYLLVKAGTTKEWLRALVGSVVTTLAIWSVGSLMQRGATAEPGGRFGYIDSLWMYPLVAGIVGYLAGRSRRGAFISATLSLVIFDIGYYIWLLNSGAPAGRVDLGGAGMFDATVVAGIFAVLLAEAVGEVRERMAGGPTRKGKPPELASALRKPNLAGGHEEGDTKKGVNEENGGERID
ncbi:MAG: hypothetical protein VR69_06790 [Peptococcaceae bacterium BRH_c4b]|nr:MAG: hypothetical protein VR69_06790 [Peptococcaceae bacterium BRH_c4b]